MPEDFFQIRLKGCTPEPLANYLKALGVFRILVESGKDPHCLAYWENEQFVLLTQLREDEIIDFFLKDYKPSPIVSPWNGSTGFYPGNKTQKVILDAILAGSPQRFEQYRPALEIPFEVIASLGLSKQPDKGDKPLMIRRLRDTMPNETAQWIDTCGMITSGGDFKTIPLLGTGGNDGNLEFGRAFMQHLQKVIDCKTGKPTIDSEKSLRAALLDQVSPQNSYDGPIGQFSPIAAGGANATTGSDAESQSNPWNFILLLKGTLVFMPGMTRRGEAGGGTIAAPFTATRPSRAGYGSAAEEKIRAELWVPLWDQPVTLGELRVTFREGRAKVNMAGGRGKVRYRTAQSGVDFARAVGNLGVARGLKAFQRYGFQERNGLSYFAVSLGRYQTPSRPKRDPLEDLDRWLRDFARLADGEKTPESIKRVNRSLERTIVEMTQGKASYLDLLIVLGEVEKVLNQSLNYVIDKIKPIPYLRSSRWVVEANDGSSEFRLALALASSGLRQRLVRVRGQTAYWQKEDDQITTWRFGSLEDNLLNLATRIEIEQERDEKAAARLEIAVQEAPDEEEENPKKSLPQSKSLNLLPNYHDVDAWIQEELDDDRLEAIARGLSLLSFTRSLEPIAARETGLSILYKTLKVAQHRPIVGKAKERLPRTRGLLSRLQADRLEDALEDALRRLRASNLRPRLDPDRVTEGSNGLEAKRLGAALALPLTEDQVQQLLKQITISDN